MSSAPGPYGSNSVRLRGVAAVAGGSVAADDSTEMYLFAFHMSNQKSVGEGSCAGCTDKACFLLSSVLLTQPLGVGDYGLGNPLIRNWVSWRCTGFIGPHGWECSYSCTVPTRNPSWGAIKSLYR